MKVIYKGNEKQIEADYNGKRVCFPKGIIVEVSQEIYNYVKDSHSIAADDIKIYEEPKKEESKKETPKVEPPKPTIKKPVKKKK